MKKKIGKKVELDGYVKPEGFTIVDSKVSSSNTVPILGINDVPKVSEIAESFGNGELNLLKEKINEIIRQINR